MVRSSSVWQFSSAGTDGHRHGLDRSGKPWQNANDESFNGKLRDECLSVEWFRSRAAAKVVIETWRLHFNAIRPHSSLNSLTPLEFKQLHHPQPSRPPGIVGPKYQGQVTPAALVEQHHQA